MSLNDHHSNMYNEYLELEVLHVDGVTNSESMCYFVIQSHIIPFNVCLLQDLFHKL